MFYFIRPQIIKIVNTKGTIYFAKTEKSLYIYSFLKNKTFFNLINQPKIIQTIIEFNGINIFDVIKSNKSKNLFENILISLKTPNDRETGKANIAIIINTMIADFFLEILKFSIYAAVCASAKLIAEVNAAKRRRIQNNIENK